LVFPGARPSGGASGLAAVAVTPSLVVAVLVSLRRIASYAKDGGVRVGGRGPNVSGFTLERGCIPFDWVGKLVVSTRRPSGGEFAAKSGNGVEKTEAFGALFGRSRGGAGEAEMGGRRARKRAEKCVETSDAESSSSRRRVVTGGLGRLAADQKAPRSEPSSKCLLRLARSLIQKNSCGH
jgi:hypothetical protein